MKRVLEEREVFNVIRMRKINWLEHVMRVEVVLKMLGEGGWKRGRRRYQMVDKKMEGKYITTERVQIGLAEG